MAHCKEENSQSQPRAIKDRQPAIYEGEVLYNTDTLNAKKARTGVLKVFWVKKCKEKTWIKMIWSFYVHSIKISVKPGQFWPKERELQEN